VQIHAEQHAVLNGLTNYGYSSIDNGTKFRKLMAGINTDALDTVKAVVLASPELRTNYPDVVTLYGDFIKQQNIESASMNVSDAHITRHHNGPASVAGSDYEASYYGVVEYRFYNYAKYRTFSPDQKTDLRLKRKHRGGDDNGRNKDNDRRSNVKRVCEDERKKDKKTIKSLTRTSVALSCKNDDPMAETFSDTTIKLQALSLTLDDSSFLQEMMSHVHISEVNMSSLTADMCDGGGVDVASLAKNFGIGIEAAKRTRLMTTQRG
jgi:uncharacterized protein (DUF305 family)